MKTVLIAAVLLTVASLAAADSPSCPAPQWAASSVASKACQFKCKDQPDYQPVIDLPKNASCEDRCAATCANLGGCDGVIEIGTYPSPETPEG